MSANMKIAQESSSSQMPNEATETNELVSKAELNELRACKRKWEMIAPKYWANKRRLEEAEAKAQEEQEKLKELKTFVTSNMQFKPQSAKIRLSLPDFAKSFEQQQNETNYSVYSKPTDIFGFQWKLAAIRRPNSDWLELFLRVSPPAQYKGPYEFLVDCSFRVFNTFPNKDVAAEFKSIQFNRGHGQAASWGANVVELEDLLDENNGFLQGNGPVQVAVEFNVKTATFDHFLADEEDEDNGSNTD